MSKDILEARIARLERMINGLKSTKNFNRARVLMLEDDNNAEFRTPIENQARGVAEKSGPPRR